MIVDKDNIKILLIVLILGLGIGYAYINSDLNINGTAQVNSANWDVHWANVQVSTGSVSVNSPTISNQTTVNYSVVLDKPGDYYEFTVDAVNGGSIDAMIDSIDSKLNGATITTLPSYLNYSITYSDGMRLKQNHQLLHNTTETYKVRIEYRTETELEQTPATNQTLNLQFAVTYRQATDAAIAVPHPVSFADDSWSTIVAAVQVGNTNNYNVGDTKTVDMGTFGTHTLRIANKSTPVECLTTAFSQTACGFVLEFADIITTHRMNPAYDGGDLGTGNVGGWPESEMRTYVNDDIYNALPDELKDGISITGVISGHGSEDYSNFTSKDKMYLLSTKEVWGKEGTTNVINNDTAEVETRQLDYYSSQNVTTSNYSGAIKQYNGSNNYWWMRSAYSNFSNRFFYVNSNGTWLSTDSYSTLGVSPAFRIEEGTR